MSFISGLMAGLERPTAGSESTAREVLKLCGELSARRVLFVGDDAQTPKIIENATKSRVFAGYAEQHRVERALEQGLDAHLVMPFELPRAEGGWEFLWYNGLTEPDGVSRRLEELKNIIKSGGTAVFRTLCYLIEPSPDTRCYVERRFGQPEELDRVLREGKEKGLSVRDFYIAPKSDWTHGLYEPLKAAVRELNSTLGDDEETAGIAELNKEMDMFELHSEEYSFVYYIFTA